MKRGKRRTKFTGNQVLQREIFFFFASVAVFAQPAKQSYHQTTSLEVLKCVIVNHRGSHSRIHHTEEDSGCGECSTGSQTERQEDSLNSKTSGKLFGLFVKIKMFDACDRHFSIITPIFHFFDLIIVFSGFYLIVSSEPAIH
ncbi:hypothetical protein YC2023_114504 [Brassica napus]